MTSARQQARHRLVLGRLPDEHSNGISRTSSGWFRSAWLAAKRHGRSRGPLSGVDETALAFRTNDPVAGGAGRSHDGKLLVVGAVEVETRRAACAWPRSRPTAVPKASTACIGHNMPPPAPPRPTAGRLRQPPVSIGSMAAHLVLPWIHQEGSRVSPRQAPAKLSKFVFRFNRRRTRHAAFRSLFGIAVCTKPFTYNMLVRPEAGA